MQTQEAHLTADTRLTVDPGVEFDPCSVPYFRGDSIVK